MITRLRQWAHALFGVTTVRHTEPVAATETFTQSLRNVRDMEVKYADEAEALAGTCSDQPALAAQWSRIANGHREQAVRYARAADLSELPRP